jgi:4a-hydroxytetrahydrobiopterin dehydratase
MAKLALRHCTPIKKGTKPISVSIARSLIKQLNHGWSFNGEARGLEQEFRFKNFHETMGFVNAVAWIASTEDHHPDLEIGYNRCRIRLTTHAAGGLTVNDFICAAKIDALYKAMPEGTTTATSEKTQAMPEPRARTGTVPRPVAPPPEFNMSEAEELLNIEIKPPAPEIAHVDDEDELKLTDPDDEPTQPHLQNPHAEPGPPVEAQDEGRQPTETASDTDRNNGTAQANLLNTVILPPGMHRVHEDKDEVATIIAQPNFEDENIELSTPADNDADEVKTMLVQALPPSEENDDTGEKENPELMKTMIIKPPLLDDEDLLNAVSDGDETLLINPRSIGQNKPK